MYTFMVRNMSGLEHLFPEEEFIDVVKYAKDFLEPLSVMDSYSPMYETVRSNHNGGHGRFTRIS
jgi:hypothetical protein